MAALFAALLAFIVKFAVLPTITTFAGLCLVMGSVLVPLGSCIAAPWRPFFLHRRGQFHPAAWTTNAMNFDAAQFYNSALAILAGIGAAALAMRLLPPLSPQRGRAGCLT